MTFRQALAGDLDAVVSLTQAAYEHYTPQLGAPPIPVTEDYTPRIERGEVWLLESGADLAGLIVIERHPDHAMIFSVAVSPAFQGKKLGTALLDFAEEQARSWGVPEVRLYTNSRMERNISIYTAYGFQGNRPPCQSPPAGMDGGRHDKTCRREHNGLIFLN